MAQKADHNRQQSGGPQQIPAQAENQQTAPPARSWWQQVTRSFMTSIGDIVFGMEDGSVSIFGLVFGVAASAPNSQTVVLAGAAGAAAAAVSMMAGAYLDVESSRSIAAARVKHEKQEMKNDPGGEWREVSGRLRNAGFNRQQVGQMVAALKQHPDLALVFEESYELQTGGLQNDNPYVHAAWMFLADLVAAFTPVIPFFFLPLSTARVTSIVVTGTLLLLVGVGRGLVSHRNVIYTAFVTLVIATAAALAGVFIGKVLAG